VISSDPLVSRLRSAGCVFAELEASELRAHVSPPDLEAAVRRRVAGEPLEYVVGWADFAGVRVRVRPPVFVPRPGAEPLVVLALSEVHRRDGRAVVVDVGCGSGAIAAAIGTAVPGVTLLGTDADVDAVRCARDNGVAVHLGDWLDALPTRWHRGVDVAVAHLPYVPTGALDQVARDYREAEAATALDGGVDGLDPLRAVLTQLDRWLAPAGVLLTLAADAQTPAVRTVLDEVGRAGRPWDGDGLGAGSTFWRIW
jgi:release factor glutamine methyltransferase